jgi:hypothetical protein
MPRHLDRHGHGERCTWQQAELSSKSIEAQARNIGRLYGSGAASLDACMERTRA